MSDWQALNTLAAAHLVALEKLERLEQTVRGLQEGRADGASEVLRDSLAFFEGELDRHFRHEELALFPALGKIIGRAGPIDAMVSEHDSIWNAVDSFTASVEELEDDGDSPDARTALGAARAANLVIFLLRGHIQREDTMLFPLAENTLNAEGKRDVDRNMEIVNADQTQRNAV